MIHFFRSAFESPIISFFAIRKPSLINTLLLAGCKSIVVTEKPFQRFIQPRLQSQRDCGVQPKVARSEQLWVAGWRQFNPNGVVSCFDRRAATPLGFWIPVDEVRRCTWDTDRYFGDSRNQKKQIKSSNRVQVRTIHGPAEVLKPE